jgi:cellulose synthase/poly-beta-1,6-N-acetylglucosamine synthase-like glycosyltransferase
LIEIMFWLSVSLIIYSYFLYPLILYIFSLLKNNRATEYSKSFCPPVTVIIAAYNEESCIKERIENLLKLDYPQEKLTLLIGSDGSSDNTAQILTSFEIDNMKPVIFPENRGKMSVLNDLVELAEDDILVLSDANTDFASDAINMLTRHFEQEDIGAVCGELHLASADASTNKDGVYWRYERFLKYHEAKLGALLGANGAIYAMRKSLFIPLPKDTVVDDFQIVMNVSKQGARIIYDQEAKANEEIAPDLSSEEARRIRIGSGNYQALVSHSWALNPMLGWRFIAYISHKVIRWFVPHLMLLAIIANILLLGQNLYILVAVTQTVFYFIAWYGISRKRKYLSVPNLIAIPAFFVAMNIALFRGFVRYLLTDVSGTWQRTKR